MSNPESQPLVFRCPCCGTGLSIARSKAGTGGPCPSCDAWITSPSGGGTVENFPAALAGRRRSELRAKSPSREVSKRRIPVDAIVDHAHLDQCESMRSIKVIAWFILAICACVAAAWFLKHSMGM